MKKTVVTILLLVLTAGFAPCALSMNVLSDHQKYKDELQNKAAHQSLENPQWIMYYKGKPEYAGASYGVSRSAVTYGTKTSQASSKKNMYAKKGIKFKVNNEDKVKIIKEQKQKEEAKEAAKKKPEAKTTKNAVASRKGITTETSVKNTVYTKSQDKKTHNADAE